MAASFKVACLGNCKKYVGIAFFVYMEKFAAGLKLKILYILVKQLLKIFSFTNFMFL